MRIKGMPKPRPKPRPIFVAEKDGEFDEANSGVDRGVAGEGEGEERIVVDMIEKEVMLGFVEVAESAEGIADGFVVEVVDEVYSAVKIVPGVQVMVEMWSKQQIAVGNASSSTNKSAGTLALLKDEINGEVKRSICNRDVRLGCLIRRRTCHAARQQRRPVVLSESICD
ncbi:MAG: hypothetical protein Q9219_002700 [cf. Caloplaca sp. 3 TL-2023]